MPSIIVPQADGTRPEADINHPFYVAQVASGAVVDLSGPADVETYFRSVKGLNQASLSFASSGSNSLLAAVANKTTRIHRIVLIAAGAVTLKFVQGSTDLTGVMSLITGIPFILPMSDEPYFITAVNAAFNATLGGAVQVSGFVDYAQS